MRVAFDAGPTLDVQTGVGRYARELGDALEAIGVDVRRYAVALRGRAGPDIARVRVPARAAQWAWRRAGAPAVTRATGPVDVVHATNFVLPALGSTPGVVTVHDLSYLRPDAFPGAGRLRELVPWSLRRAARVLVPTEAVRAELAAHYGVPADRVDVTPEGVSPVFFGATPLSDVQLDGLGLRPPFAVAVGTLEPRKNLARLLRAWRAAALDGWTLALAGPRGWGGDLPETPGVVPIGWVGDATLPGLLAAAEVFCYVSLYEGFGLPPLEAMAAGTPVLAGRYSAAPEVLGDAAVLVDPLDEDAIAHDLAALAGDADRRRALARAGRARAVGYTWARTALTTLAAYRAAL
ncbi:MAG TPA: glycosyltransferase family 1 protein [Actinomycetota bacterium]|nr:glycosyltransferase family 1 protein [Actinomycetota bacterium]